MNDIYWTSDLHLSHASILKGFRGTIFKSVEEHNEIITENLLAIPRGSRLYLLGDLFWKFNSEQIKEFFDKFQKKKIQIFIILGNHDKGASTYKHKAVKSISYIKEITVEKQPITMCHYPLLIFNRSHYSSINLYGHIHKGDHTFEVMKTISNIDQILGKSLNVNLEFHQFRPWSFEEILEEMKNKPDNWDLIKK